MNKYQKALDLVSKKWEYVPDDCYEALEPERNILQELCNKEIPLKPIYEKDEIGDREAFGGTGYMTFANATCPNCNEYLDEENKPYRCTNCGQIIDWYDDDDFYDEDEGDYD